MRKPARTRETWQRKAIARAVGASPCHATAAEIHRSVSRGGRPVGLATVYRALEAMVRAGAVEEARFSDGRVRYGLAANHHDHLVCLNCGRPEPLARCTAPRGPRRPASGFRITGHRLDYFGYCLDCQGAAGPRRRAAPRRRGRR